MDFTDWYIVLDVDDSASLNEIRRAYKRKALELHPDKNPHADAAQQFSLLQEAFNVLSDSNARHNFDAVRAQFVSVSKTKVRSEGRIRALKEALKAQELKERKDSGHPDDLTTGLRKEGLFRRYQLAEELARSSNKRNKIPSFTSFEEAEQFVRTRYNWVDIDPETETDIMTKMTMKNKTST
ncbi:hypothetical protein DASB73_012290 [Starmerella bacillaris]|uniref:J domain-containing protein n=1 Tax=Starmerella bacillaris TaxID=1247836 RepID=A0AAV5RGG6_STABA|nr:hypothetical protein DASB73_012290 [Starmerella bacillaris]